MDVDSKWQKNTSKKIVQMTMNVYRLHTYSLDNKDRIDQKIVEYQDEIKQIKAISEKNIKKSLQKNEKYKPLIEDTVKSEFETKYQQIKVEFEKVKENVDKKSNIILNNATRQLSEINTKVLNLENQVNQINNFIQEAEGEIRKLHEIASNKIEKKKQSELEKHIKEANSEYEIVCSKATKNEEETRQELEEELDEYKKALTTSRQTTIEAIEKRRKEFQTNIENIQTNKLDASIESLLMLFESQKSESENHIKTFEKCNEKIIFAIQKKYNQSQNNFAEYKAQQISKIQILKDQINSEKQQHENYIKQLKLTLEQEKEKYLKLLHQYEEKSKNLLSADEKSQKLNDKYQLEMENLNTFFTNNIEEAHQREINEHLHMIEMQQKHFDEIIKIRKMMENKIEESKNENEKLKNKFINEINEIKNNEIEKTKLIQNKMKENSAQSQNIINEYQREIEKIKIEMLKLKQEMEINIINLNFIHSNEISLIKKKNDEIIKNFENESEEKNRELDITNLESTENLKKKFILDSKILEEKYNNNLKQKINEIKYENKNKQIEEFQLKNDIMNEQIDEINQIIENKIDEKTNLEITNKNLIISRQSHITKLKKELEKNEIKWQEERQNYINEWNKKFENLKIQFQDEAKLNEDARRMTKEKYLIKMNELRNELDEIEKNKMETIQQFKEKKIIEMNTNENKIKSIKNDFEIESNKHIKNIEEINIKIKNLKEENERELKNFVLTKENELNEYKKELKNVINEGRKNTKEIKEKLYNIKRNHQNELLDKRIDLYKFDFETQRNLKKLKRKKEFELKQKLIKQNHQIEMKEIELQLKKEENEQIRYLKIETNEKINANHQKNISDLNEKYKNERKRIKKENKSAIEEKQKMIDEFQNKDSIDKSEIILEDTEYIKRIEEIVLERADFIEKFNKNFKNIRKLLISHETNYQKAFTGEPPQQSLNPINDQKPKIESSFGSQKRIPALVSPRPFNK